MSDPDHTPRSRDAALRRLARANRWLLAGSAALTGVLTAVAASAFPGKTLKTTDGSAAVAAQQARASHRQGSGTSTSSSPALTAPCAGSAVHHAPGSGADPGIHALRGSLLRDTLRGSVVGSASAGIDALAGGPTPSQQATPSQKAAPTQESSTPSQESTPAQESGTVVSGAS